MAILIIAVWILAALLALSVAASALGAADRDALNKTGRFYYTDEAKAEWVYYGSAVTKASQGDSAEIRAVAWGRGDELDGDDPELRLFVEDRDGKAMNVQKEELLRFVEPVYRFCRNRLSRREGYGHGLDLRPRLHL